MLLRNSTRSRIGVVGGVPAGARSGTSAAVPSDSRVTTTRPSAMASAVHADKCSSAHGTRERDRMRRSSSKATPREPSRRSSELRRNTSGRPLSSSHGSSALSRPPTPTVAGLAGPRRTGSRDRPRRRGSRPGSGRSAPSARARGGATSRRPARQYRRGRGEGGSPGDDSRDRPRAAAARRVQGNAVARRNLLDAWTLMSSPPLASLGPFGLPSTLLAAGSGGQWAYPPISPGSCMSGAVVHRLSTATLRGRAGSAGALPPGSADRSPAPVCRSS